MRLSPASLGLSRFGALGALLAFAAAATSAACGSDPCTSAECGGTGASSSSGGSNGGGTARSGPCASDATCDTAHGFSCTAGECRYPCGTHFDCEGEGVCDTLEGDDGASHGTYCTLLEEPLPEGQYYTRCPTYTECDGDAGFTCLGAGVGDSDAYCSASCGADDDCPKGFFCVSVSDSSGKSALYCVRRRFCAPCSTD